MKPWTIAGVVALLLFGSMCGPAAAAPFAYILGGASVSVVDQATNTVVGTIPVGDVAGSLGIFLGPDVAAVQVPTLSEWAMIAPVAVMLAAGVSRLAPRSAR